MCLEKWSEDNIKKMEISEEIKNYARGGSTGVLLAKVKRDLDSLVRELQNSIFEQTEKEKIYTTSDLYHSNVGAIMASIRKINSRFGTRYETDPFKIKEYYGIPLLRS